MEEGVGAENKKHILFVDDEQRVLDGLRRMLYSMRNEWEMYFATSGNAALELMQAKRFDVIVSDMRMPEMDGAALLNKVKEKHPHVIRFILSGYSDKDMILRTIGATDQFLTKPCDPTVLKETILNTLNAQSIVDEQELRSMVSEMNKLPTLPDLYVKLKKILESPTSSFDEVSDVVAKDISISAKVLQLVNSSFFGLKHRIDSIKHAVTYLGVETMKAIVLTADVFSQFTDEEIRKFNIQDLYNHSLITGLFAQKITRTIASDPKFIDEVGMAAILHDIGKVIFIRNVPDVYEEVYRRQQSTHEPLYIIEKELMGSTHAAIGGYLMGLWGLPENIIKAITFHHSPLSSPHSVFNTISAVHCANIIIHKNRPTAKGHEKIDFDNMYIEKLKLATRIPEWQVLCANLMKEHDKANDL